MNVGTQKPVLEPSVAARISGEDIVCGDFVAVLNEVFEFPSFLWDGAGVSLAPEEPVTVRFAARDAGTPNKVIGVCLPFVYAQTHLGCVAVIDTRQRHLVRLDYQCAHKVWKKMKAAARKSAK